MKCRVCGQRRAPVLERVRFQSNTLTVAIVHAKTLDIDENGDPRVLEGSAVIVGHEPTGGSVTFPMSPAQERTLGVDYIARGPYQELIQQILSGRELERYIDPRHVEAFMRNAHPCLDGLSRQEFDAEAEACIHTVLWDKEGLAERLAQSFGL